MGHLPVPVPAALRDNAVSFLPLSITFITSSLRQELPLFGKQTSKPNMDLSITHDRLNF